MRAAKAGRAEWAASIRDMWTTAAEAFIGAGRELIDAKATLRHGEFEAMVEDDLPFGPRTARRLMAIALDPRIADRTHVSVLPASWRMLYELTRLDDEALERAFAAGDINAEMGRADVARIRRQAAAGDDGGAVEAAACAVEDLYDLAASQTARFGAILADPPWTFETYSAKGKGRSAERHYPCMTDNEIAGLPVTGTAKVRVGLPPYRFVGPVVVLVGGEDHGQEGRVLNHSVAHFHGVFVLFPTPAVAVLAGGGERERFLRSRRPSCIAIGDLDHFKRVNDAYGHAAGDRVLIASAECFLGQLRPYDSVYRYGGEEFLFCLPDADMATAHTVLERLRQELESHAIEIDGGETLSVTGSFGVAEMTPEATIEQTIEHADRALYRAKSDGRNRVCQWQPAATPAARQGGD